MFSHLHVHTHYSMLDGAGKVEELILRAKELGQPAIAITDHGSTSGLLDAQNYGEKHGIKILQGSEFYYQDFSNRTGHLILLAKNQKGLENIYNLQSKAYMENFYYKPRINYDMLKLYSSDLVCLSGCIANPIFKEFLDGHRDKAKEYVDVFTHLFGEDFYLEIQANTLSEQRKVNEWLALAPNTVITNDVHYVYKDDAFAHEVMLALQNNTKMDDPKRFKFDTQDYWLKSEQEMRESLSYLATPVIDKSIDNIQKIVDSCNTRIEAGDYLPHYYKCNSKEEENKLLRKLTTAKYHERIIPRKLHNKSFQEDVAKELKVIEETGYAGYFLIVQDYVNYAKANNILVGDGRGSGAGSKVAFTLGITEVNPQDYNLLFERFLSPGRTPDFDVDFSDIDAMFKYLQSVYGENNVAKVGAFGTLTCKACIRKVLSCFGHSQAVISKVSGYLPKRLHFTLADALSESRELREFASLHQEEFGVIKRLEGVISHQSKHAGGVIICQGIESKLPIIRDADDPTKRVVALDKYQLESLGHYKFDVLGLESLKLIKDTLNFIDPASPVDLSTINREDVNIYNMLSNGDVLGVFQLSDQRHKVIEQKPQNFTDLIAINALIRPGVGDWDEYVARRNGKHYDIEEGRKPYLSETCGVITYQEQFLLDCLVYAGWTIDYSDKHVRKNKDILNDNELQEKFIKDAIAYSHITEDLANYIWYEICQAVSSGYGFNKSHSTSYAMLSYQTAWLKYYYPKEFYSALLTQNSSDPEMVETIIRHAMEQGIKFVLPDINTSLTYFKPTKEGILFSLNSIKGVGDSAVNAIVQMRPIQNIDDLLKRRNTRILKVNVIEKLIKAGCFDFETTDRYKLLCSVSYQNKKQKPIKQSTATMEKEALGFYLTSHPLDKYSFNDIKNCQEGSECITIGEVSKISETYDKNGKLMAFVTISNQYGLVETIWFTDIWTKQGKGHINVENTVLVKGKLSKGKILTNKFELLEEESNCSKDNGEGSDEPPWN